MNLDNLKTAFAKERRAELMIGSGGAILVSVMASLFAPETLKLLDAAGPIPSQLGKVLIWSTAILGGALLIYRGLNRIDNERATSTTLGTMPAAAPTDTTSPLTLQITQGSTCISINIQPEKIKTQ